VASGVRFSSQISHLVQRPERGFRKSSCNGFSTVGAQDANGRFQAKYRDGPMTELGAKLKAGSSRMRYPFSSFSAGCYWAY
jgi:hypothetical protein